MNSKDQVRRYCVWLAVLILLSMVIIFAAWFFQLLPEYVLRLALAPLITLFLIVLLASSERFSLRLGEFLTKYHGRFQRSRGLLYKYGRALNAITMIALLTVCLVLYYNPALLSIEYMPHAVFTLFVAFLISTIIFIAGVLGIVGKWGLLLIVIITVIVAFRFLMRD